jgi:hypothetical protein
MFTRVTWTEGVTKQSANRVFGSKTGEIIGRWRCLSKELHIFAPNIIRLIKLRMVRWVAYVDPMGEMINAGRDLVGKPERKRLLGRSRRRREDNIKIFPHPRCSHTWELAPTFGA